MELLLLIISNHYLGKKEVGLEVFKLLQRNIIIKPTHFDPYEPIKTVFDDEKKFIDVWCGEIDQVFSSILWRRKKSPKVDGMAVLGKGKFPQFNRLSWSLPSGHFDLYESFFLDVADFFGKNEFIFGRICLQEEYYKNNILKNTSFYYNKQGEKIFHPPGSISPILPVGLDLRKHLPGLYWRTFLGKVYVDWFGKEKVLTTPAYSISELPNGAVCLQMYERPEMFSEPSAQETIKKAKFHLGEDAFFDKNDIDRETKAPFIDVSEITL